MRYFEIATRACPSLRVPPTHPVLLHLEIECERWHQFERLADDNSDIYVMWHGTRDHQRMMIYVACTSEEIAGRLEDGWA